jgi:hypothetical protein
MRIVQIKIKHFLLTIQFRFTWKLVNEFKAILITTIRLLLTGMGSTSLVAVDLAQSLAYNIIMNMIICMNTHLSFH